MGAHVVLDPKQCDVVAEIKKLTGGGADVAIEALGLQVTFENALRCLRPGGTLSSLGVYSGKLQVPYDAFAAGLGDYKIVTTLCPGGKERMRRLMSMVQSKRFDPLPLLTHSFKLDQIVEAYDVFGSRRDGCLKGGDHGLDEDASTSTKTEQMNGKKRITGRPIVCGTDFSATATEAVDIAAAMARRLETSLVLIHVDELLGALTSNPVVLEAAILQRRSDLDDEAQRLRELGTRVEEKFLSGSAFDELVTAATKFKAGLVVLGAVGHGLARRLFLGSVAERTAEASPVPTLVVRPKSTLAAWIDGKHVLKILVGYDFSAASDAALGWVNELGKIGKLETTVLYTNWPPDEARRLGYEGPLPLAANPEEIQKNLEGDLKKRIARFLPKQKVTAIVEPGWGTPEGYLFEMASRRNVDLIVVGTHQRQGLGRVLLGSVSRAVLHHAKVSVAVVPPAETAYLEHEQHENENIHAKSSRSRQAPAHIGARRFF